jgi:hypothetical protein
MLVELEYLLGIKPNQALPAGFGPQELARSCRNCVHRQGTSGLVSAKPYCGKFNFPLGGELYQWPNPEDLLKCYEHKHSWEVEQEKKSAPVQAPVVEETQPSAPDSVELSPLDIAEVDDPELCGVATMSPHNWEVSIPNPLPEYEVETSFPEALIAQDFPSDAVCVPAEAVAALADKIVCEEQLVVPETKKKRSKK